jgi:hypothetical protein
MICRTEQLLTFKSVCEAQLCAVSPIREANARVLPVSGQFT